jgi:hypothetical protein
MRKRAETLVTIPPSPATEGKNGGRSLRDPGAFVRVIGLRSVTEASFRLLGVDRGRGSVSGGRAWEEGARCVGLGSNVQILHR